MKQYKSKTIENIEHWSVLQPLVIVAISLHISDCLSGQMVRVADLKLLILQKN